ncbi:NAD-dependent epimerase/dehydratase family protein [Bacteroides fragilis]
MFIGKNLVRCLSPYYQITVFDKYIDYDFFCCYPEVATVVMNLATEKIAAEYPTPSFIINLASIVTAERDLSLFDGLISSNLKILLNLYDRFKGDDSLRLFIQFGSSEEYGSEGSPFVETQRERPNSPYALVKQLTTNTAIMLYDNYGFPTMVVRPGNLFGPGQNKSKFIPYVIEQLRKGEPLNVSPCEQRRDFIHVDVFSLDIHGLLKHADRVVGQIVNVSSGQSISLRQIIDFYKEALHSTSEINYGALSYRENEAMDLRCNIGKLLMIVNTEHDEMNAFKSLIKE